MIWITFFPFQSAGSQRRLPPCNFDRIDNLPVHLGYNGTSNGSRVNLELVKGCKDANGHEESVSWNVQISECQNIFRFTY